MRSRANVLVLSAILSVVALVASGDAHSGLSGDPAIDLTMGEHYAVRAGGQRWSN